MAGGGGRQQGAEFAAVLVGRVEPGAPVGGRDGQRHAGVDVSGGIDGLGRDDGAGRPPRRRVVVLGHRRVAPELVQPGERHDLTVFGADEIRLLAGLGRLGRRYGLPLVEAVRGQQATALGEGPAVGRLLGHGLHPRVDHFRAHVQALRPRRHQPPAQRPQLPGDLAGVPLDAFQHRPHGVGRGHIPARVQRLAGIPAHDVEQVHKVLRTAGGDVATAHTSTLPGQPVTRAGSPPPGARRRRGRATARGP